MNIMKSVPSLMEKFQVSKKFKSQSRGQLNFQGRSIVCTTLYINPMHASNFRGTVDQLSFDFFYGFHRRCFSTSSIA